MKTIFDLIATLYRDFLELSKVFEYTGSITDEDEDKYNIRAFNLVNDKIECALILAGDKKCINSEDYSDIINTCKSENNYYFYRAVLCNLDSLIDKDDLVYSYDFSNYSFGKESMFNALNDNGKETKVTIIPKVNSFNNTILIGDDDKKYQDANHWYNEINTRLNSVICLDNDKLNGYKINNVVLKLINNSINNTKDNIIIGFTPITNEKVDDLVQINRYYNEDLQQKRFEINDYIDASALTSKFLSSLSKATDNDIDIFAGPEILGSFELSEPNDGNYNTLLIQEHDNAPRLIITPSYWVEGKNYISVYYKSGKLIGKQYKQNRCEEKKEGIKYVENLIDIPREILILHIHGWGRIAFPICIDLLISRYKEIMVKEIKADYLLCPSYSEGVVQFSNESGAATPFGTKVMWLNTCSALRKYYEKPEFIGYASAPVNVPEETDPICVPIKPVCSGECCDGCYFKISIQGRSTELAKCNEIKIDHYYKGELS